MEDYPRTLVEFEARFGREEACREYLVPLRWPQWVPVPALWHFKLGGRSNAATHAS